MIDPNIDLKALSDEELIDLHEKVHELYAQGSENIEDVFNLHKLIVEEMERRGIEHHEIDDLDILKLVRLINSEYFKSWSPASAYMIGFIAADGSIIWDDDRGIYRLDIEISPRDRDLLERFAKELQYAGDLAQFDKGVVALQINDKELVESLLKIGLKPKKEGFPSVPRQYLSHFIRGFFDANGSVYLRNGTVHVRFAGREHAIRNINKIIADELGIDEKTIVETAGTHVITYVGKDAKALLRWMYEDANIYLDRKKKIVDQIELEYMTPQPSGESKGKEITLDEVRKHLKGDRIAISKPFIFLTGGLVNHGKTKNDIDILIRAKKDDSFRVPIEFRILRLFPKEWWNRIQFIYEGDQDSMGPFTNHIPLFDLELVLRDDLQVVEMSANWDFTDNPLDIYLVGGEKKPYADMFEGVMLNAYTLKSRKSLEPWIDEYIEKGKTIMLDNAAFQSQTLSPSELAERVREIRPHIVVAPDDIFSPNSHEKTIEMTKKFMSMNLPDDVKICVVGQGQSIKAYEWCIRELIKLEPDYIGLGRMSMKVAQYPGTHFQQRLVALDRLQQEGILDEIKDAGIKMHSLGISNPHEFKYLNYYGFASCDSMSYIYSALYRQLPLPDEPDEKPFQFDADGRVKPKPFDTEERLKAKEKLAKEFLQLESTDKKFAFVLKLWKELQRLIARDEHIEMHVREYRGFDPDEIDYFYISRPDQRKPENPDLDRQIKEVAESVSEKA